MKKIFKSAKAASEVLRKTSSKVRDNIIFDISNLIIEYKAKILEANMIDVENGKESGLTSAMIDRLLLNDDRINELANSTLDISKQEDPVGQVLDGYVRPNGLKITKIRVPLGVVGIIYESRPNVTIDCAALCIRSGNVAILRGGSEAINTNLVLADIVKEALEKSDMPQECVTLLNDPDRKLMLPLIQAVGSVDLIVPRGGPGLIKYVAENSHVPVVMHDKGVCHIFVDASANTTVALDIVENAKMSRPSACNAIETVLIHTDIAKDFLPKLATRLKAAKLYGCEVTRGIIDVEAVADWGVEYLDYTMNIKVVSGLEAATKHIAEYGSAHSDAIVTESYTNAEEFLDTVDSACVYVNASTRYTDGGEFGLGAEVGISTQKTHSRGPMGAFDLTTTKYKIHGNGQIR